MATQVWSGGPFDCALRGNLDRARQLVRFARVRAGYLLGQLGPNHTYRHDTWHRPDGSMIQVHVWRDELGERVMARIFGAGVPTAQEWVRGQVELYHGWLTWYPEAYPGDPLAMVWVGGDLADYLASGDSGGTIIPDTGSTPLRQYLFGKARAAPGRSCQGRPAPDWAEREATAENIGNPPDLDADLAYRWPLEAPRSQVGQGMPIWIGEARGMDQALRGAGRTWAEALPRSWGKQATNTAIFWSPAGELWAAEIDESMPGSFDLVFLGKDEVAVVNGVEVVTKKASPTEDLEWYTVHPGYTVTIKMVKLSVPRILLCVLRWLHEDREELTDLDIDLLRAYCYASAYTEDGAAVITLIAQEAHTKNHVYLGSSLHPFTNWHPYWQPTKDAEARITKTWTWKASFLPGQNPNIYSGSTVYSHSRTVDVEILWNNEGRPVDLRMDVSEPYTWASKWFRYWYPTGNGLEVIPENDPTHDLPKRGEVYSFTAADGYAYRVKKEGYGDPSPEQVYSNGGGYPTICGAGEEMRYSGTRGTGVEGGWSVEGGPSQASAKITPVQSGSYYERTVRIFQSDLVTVSWPPDSPNGIATLAIDTAYLCTGNGIEDQFVMDADNDSQAKLSWTIGCGSAEIRYSSISNGVGDGFATLVFLPTDSGVFIGKYQKWDSGAILSKEANLHYNKDVSYSGIFLSWDLTGSDGQAYQGTTYNGRFRFGPYAFGFGFSRLMNGYGETDGDIVEDADMAGRVDHECFIVSSSRSKKQVEYQDWADLFSQLKHPSNTYAPLALATWRGELIYSKAFNEITVPAGLSQKALAAPNLAPIGAV